MSQLKLTGIFLSLVLLLHHCQAQVNYPAPVHYIHLTIENKKVKMAYMDIPSAVEGNKVIVLLHGKNFNGYYWKNLVPFLTSAGFRVIIPDQVGWGKSDKPDLHYSFHLLAYNTKILLDSLKVRKAIVLGHSMGGMLAIRFSLLFPDRVGRLILEDPIGLEDYKTFVSYQKIDELFKKERSATYESYKRYQQGYYPEWKPDYEQYVKAQAEVLKGPGFEKIAWANALTTDMIYQQPVIYEIEELKIPVLLVIGQVDRTIVGKDLLSDAAKTEHGNYPEMGRQFKNRVTNSIVVELSGIGHIPHIQDLQLFENSINSFLLNQVEEF
ncbi:MAG: alpha/beta hydrolase [Chitinophagaceae bacterium]